MKYFLLFLLACSTHKTEWDSGAQKQEANDFESYQQQQDTLREQFPSPVTQPR